MLYFKMKGENPSDHEKTVVAFVNEIGKHIRNGEGSDVAAEGIAVVVAMMLLADSATTGVPVDILLHEMVGMIMGNIDFLKCKSMTPFNKETPS